MLPKYTLMIVIILFELLACKNSYKLHLINMNSKNPKLSYKKFSNVEYTIDKEKAYYLPMSIPEQIDTLFNIDCLKIKNKTTEYEISPFRYFKAENQNKEKYFGKFDKMKVKNDCVVCWYNAHYLTDPMKKLKFKVFYLPSSNEPEIKKYFEEDPNTFAFYVKGNFLCRLKECYVFDYLINVDTK